MQPMDRSPRSNASADMDLMDLRLREILAPRPEAVERIVRGALASRPAHRRPLLTAAPVAALLVIAIAIFVALPPRPAAKAEPSRVSISNAGGVVIARSTSGEGWVIQSRAPQSPARDEQILIVYGGDR